MPAIPWTRKASGAEAPTTEGTDALRTADESPSNQVIGKLRIQVLRAQNLVGKDRNGKSDPFVLLNLPGAPPPPSSSSSKRDKEFYRRVTPVQSKTLDPIWRASEATFEWDITPQWYGSALDLHTGQEQGRGSMDHDDDETNINRYDTLQPVSDVRAMTASPIPEVSTNLQAISLQDGNSTRPSSVRKLSSATGKILSAPVRITTKSAVATTRAVRRRGRPRPMRLRRGQALVLGRAPSGSAAVGQSDTSTGTVSVVEFVTWDKDRWSGNDYLGECSLQVCDWVPEGQSAHWDASEPMMLPLGSSRRNSKVSGDLIIRLGILPANEKETADDIYFKLIEASSQMEQAGIRSVPADQSVGTTGPADAFLDDGLSSGSEDEAQEELLSDDDQSVTDDDTDTMTEGEEMSESENSMSGSLAVPHLRPVVGLQQPHPTITTEADKQEEPIDPDSQLGMRRRIFPNRLRKTRSFITTGRTSTGTSQTPSGNTSDVDEDSTSSGVARRRKIRVRQRKAKRTEDEDGRSSAGRSLKGSARQRRREARRRQRQDFSLKTSMGMDIIGIVQMEVKGAIDLPRWKNSLGTSFDMDAFVIVSFGQRIFRTRVARHSLNPTWDEKLLFHVRRHEANYTTKLAIYDWDKLSSNDFVGETSLPICDLIEAAPKPDPVTELFAENHDAAHKMQTFTLDLTRVDKADDSKSMGKHEPKLILEARYMPYAALRQRFWRQLLLQYDTNDSSSLSVLELTAMLDSLGSTLTTDTIEGFFSQNGKNSETGDELTIDEAILALENEIAKPFSQKRIVKNGAAVGGLDLLGATPLDSGIQTPALGDVGHEFPPQLDVIDYSGPQAPSANKDDLSAGATVVPQQVIDGPTSRGQFTREVQRDTSNQSLGPASSFTSSSSSSGNDPVIKMRDSSPNSSLEGSAHVAREETPVSEQEVERVIMLRSCPLCRMPRLSKKAEVDIVTHLAVCASQDWRRVDSMMVGNYVTAMQAHRKWVTKAITKISQGQYQLGANSANIIVQDRLSGQMLEEKMQAYVRLGIRLLYKGARSRMEGARIKRMLRNMSIKQGIKFDSPQSVREIPQFIAFHSLNIEEIRDPLDSFKTFNEFFYRKLKVGARPIEDPEDPMTLVSGADCRLMAFSSIDEASRIWIKGRDFTIERLLGDGFLPRKYKSAHWSEELNTYRKGGAFCIFRLAPQDYHRFHCPADATVGPITYIDGQYYTVNPMAIRSAIDVYCENIRVVVPLISEQFGTFYYVCIGAMMVGSTCLTVKEGDQLKRGDEIGYFKFGSTIAISFPDDTVQFDDDLLSNSGKAIETLVRVGMRIGRSTHA